MTRTGSEYKEELIQEIEGLPADQIKEVLDFACFIKARDAIDPSQAYFWTRQWQEMEADADQDKAHRRVVGNGTVEDLLKELKK